MKARILGIVVTASILGAGFMFWRSTTTPDFAGNVSPSVPHRGGQLVGSIRAVPKSFDWIVSREQTTELLSFLTQGRLVRINRATFELEPRLAESWDASPDGRTFTLHLRQNLTWSDGVPFTSADVLFTFQAALDPKSESVIADQLTIGGKPIAATAPDANTVVLTYPAPSGLGLRLLDPLTILPKHKLEAALAAGTFVSAWNSATPPSEIVGMGPFMLRDYVPSQRMVLERNPRYWRKAADGTQLPYLDRIVLEVVPDQDAELLRLQSGDIDMTMGELRPDDYVAARRAEDQGKLKVTELGVSTNADAFWFCLKPDAWKKDPRFAFVSKPEFRQAISYAVDREAFAENVFLGAAVPIWGPITPGNKNWFSPNIKRYPHSLDKAKELLKSIGLENRDADEWLEDDKGTEARFTLLSYRGNSNLERSSFVLRDELKKIGIDVDVQLLEQGALLDRMVNTGKFESIFFLFSMTSLDPAMNSDFWLSSGSAHVWNIAEKTPATDWERDIDKLINRMASSGDVEQRKSVFNEAQQILAENVPVLFFVTQRLYMGVSTRVGSLQPSFLRPQLLWSADTISVAPGSK